eukprot:7453693-Alexandrium_andersonii.AAC.1
MGAEGGRAARAVGAMARGVTGSQAGAGAASTCRITGSIMSSTSRQSARPSRATTRTPAIRRLSGATPAEIGAGQPSGGSTMIVAGALAGRTEGVPSLPGSLQGTSPSTSLKRP